MAIQSTRIIDTLSEMYRSFAEKAYDSYKDMDLETREDFAMEMTFKERMVKTFGARVSSVLATTTVETENLPPELMQLFPIVNSFTKTTSPSDNEEDQQLAAILAWNMCIGFIVGYTVCEELDNDFIKLCDMLSNLLKEQ